MDRWQYTMVLAGCVALTLPLELVMGARVYRRPARLAATLAPVAAVFIVWDTVAARRGHWWWTADLITGARLLGVPLEEWLFFLVVPVCAVLTYEALGIRRPRRSRRAGQRGHAQPGAPATGRSARHTPLSAPEGATRATTGTGHGT